MIPIDRAEFVKTLLAKGLSVRQVAARAQVARPTVVSIASGQWERSKYRPDTEEATNGLTVRERAELALIASGRQLRF